MNVGELLDAAKRKQGSLGAVAQRMGIEQSRLSKWRSGDRKPDAADIMLLAEMAGLPPFETLAQIEQEIDEKNASIWARALGNLRAAGVAATVILGLSIFSTMPKNASAAVTNFVTPSPAEAAPAINNGVRVFMLCQINDATSRTATHRQPALTTGSSLAPTQNFASGDLRLE